MMTAQRDARRWWSREDHAAWWFLKLGAAGSLPMPFIGMMLGALRSPLYVFADFAIPGGFAGYCVLMAARLVRGTPSSLYRLRNAVQAVLLFALACGLLAVLVYVCVRAVARW